MHDYLTQPQHAPILSSLKETIVTPVITSIADAVARSPDGKKRQLSSLVAPHYHRSTLQALGFPISSSSFTTARKHAQELFPGAPPSPTCLPPSKQPPSSTTLSTLSSFLDSHSQPAACRTIKVDGVITPARILSHTHAELHREWRKQGNSSLLSLSAFTRAVKSFRVYKPVSRRSTDMCDHCVEGRHHDALLRRRLDQHLPDCVFVSAVHSIINTYQSHDMVPPPIPASSSLPSCTCSDVTQTDRDATSALLAPVCFYHHHRVLKDQLHAVYKRQQAEIGDGEVVVTLDYKENIKLNVGPEETSRQFYHHSHRTVLGFLLQYRNPTTREMCNQYIDFISSSLTHDAAFALDCLRQVITRFLLPLHLHQLHLWCDRGRHFQCDELVAGVTCMLPSEFGHLSLSADVNFFAEKHGKSAVDGHFSLLSRWLKQAAAQQHLHSNEQLLSALRAQADSHLQVLRNKKKPSHTVTFILYTPPCVEHSSGEHDILLPSSSFNNTAQPPVPVSGEDELPELDDDGDVCMSDSPQLVSTPSSLSFPPSSDGAAAATTCFDQRESLMDERSVDSDMCADRDNVMSAERCIDDDVQMVVRMGRSRQQAHSESAITDTAAHAQHQYSRVEERVKCTRPPSLVPSLKLPNHSPVTLSTHYHWRALSLSRSSPPSPHSTAVSNTTNTSTHALPLAPEPSRPCPVTLVASVVPHSSVWPEQTIHAQYQRKPCSKQYIAFAPRLQTMPDVVVHKNCMSAMQKRLTSLQKVSPRIDAQRALQIVQSIADSFCTPRR